MINIFGDQGNKAKNFVIREHELKTFLGARGFINEEQGIESKKIKGSKDHGPRLGGAHYVGKFCIYTFKHSPLSSQQN